VSESNTYQLATLKDVFEKLPSDRIRDCMNELGILLSQAADTRDLFMAAAKDIGLDPAGVIPKLPEFFTWIDDGKGELSFHVHAKHSESDEGEEVFTINTQVPAE